MKVWELLQITFVLKPVIKSLHNDPEVEKKQGWTTVGDMEGCGHYRVGEEDTTQWQGTFVYEKRGRDGVPG